MYTLKTMYPQDIFVHIFVQAFLKRNSRKVGWYFINNNSPLFLHRYGHLIRWPSNSLAVAAANGNIFMMKWFYKHGPLCLNDGLYCFDQAILNCRLDSLKLLKNFFPLCDNILRSGEDNYTHWCVYNNRKRLINIVVHNRIDILEWLHDYFYNPNLINLKIFIFAIKLDRLTMIKYMTTNWNLQKHIYAIERYKLQKYIPTNATLTYIKTL